MKKTLLSATLAGIALAVGIAAPASAAEDTTIVTLTVIAEAW